ncbi:hypothetical protein quinque_007635 [Culex quinquefasciatus]
MRVTYFLLLVTAFAFLAAFQPAVEAAPQDVATAEVAAPEARQEGSDGKPEGAADGPTSDGGKKGHEQVGKEEDFELRTAVKYRTTGTSISERPAK